LKWLVATTKLTGVSAWYSRKTGIEQKQKGTTNRECLMKVMLIYKLDIIARYYFAALLDLSILFH